MKTVKVKEVLENDYVLVDVRTPKEFEESTIPGAINIPLFSNEERAIVGRLYTKVGQKEAIEKGYGFVQEKLPKLLEEIKKYKGKKLVIFCWRGGMRSKCFTMLLENLGFDVMQLEGGHKAYRKHVIEELSKYKIKAKLIVLYGLTGSGKTKLLKKFKNSLDLEDLAQHRSSLFGDIGLKPRSQKMFESLLLKRLKELKNEKYIITEGESRKIGNVIIPENIFKQIHQGIKVKVEASMEQRIKNLVECYSNKEDHKIIEKIKLLRKRIGNKKTKQLLELFEKKKFEDVARILLEEYYDPLYAYTINNQKYSLVIKPEMIREEQLAILS
ncbi:MAG: tRNA 2-selenouridine(34) synthase MnmH [Candidatus Nanoarchaeia archaeon]